MWSEAHDVWRPVRVGSTSEPVVISEISSLRIDGEIDAGDDFFVRAGQAEGLAILNVRPGNNLDACDMGAGSRGEKEDEKS